MSENATSSEATPNSVDGRVVKRVRRQRVQLSCGECRAKKVSSAFVHFLRLLMCVLSSYHATAIGLARDVSRPGGHICAFMTRKMVNRRWRTSSLGVSDKLRLQTTMKFAVCVPKLNSFGACLPVQILCRGIFLLLLPFAIRPSFDNNQIPELYPFISGSVEVWLKPAGVHLKKYNSTPPTENLSSLDVLLPSKDDTDILVKFYLDHCEQLHRVIHVPTFAREYAKFWVPNERRSPATTALVLSMITISASTSSLGANCRNDSARWLMACEDWSKRQSPKRHRLIHYQIACLVYLAKRINMVHKKRFWSESALLVQKAMIDGLHDDTLLSRDDSTFATEMRRRIWSTIRELDLQNSYEHGLPTLLHNIDSDVPPPSNIDDEAFDEALADLPGAEPFEHYTGTSYQALSAQSWAVRVDVSRRLYSPALSQSLIYDEVLHYTHELTQHIAKLPNWGSCSQTGLHKVTNAFLQFQLMECILAIHRPYLNCDNSKHPLSEDVCHRVSRDILLLNLELKDLGLQSLVQVREDLLLASLSLARVTMLQPLRSNSVIMSCSDAVVDLLERCVPIAESRYLQSCNSEPWCFITMCAAYLILKIHVGKIDSQTAEYICAQKFLDLYYKHSGSQQTPSSNQNQEQPLLQNGLAPVAEQSTQNEDQSATQTALVPDVGTFAEWLNTDLFDFGGGSSDFLSGLDDVYL
ncbi:hypothetical protein D6D15_07968 [Aureobasidium pullulans]|uniref:Xylanolytic transcriptional activator regulatory domain-containing protein n=1 Tax=Aureobasidium pullulans TaxID=5580 RepID=A0A4V4IUI4_AURPU|nr:hypothetical protein D6D15_07968 [Aureobasidium pullulans]